MASRSATPDPSPRDLPPTVEVGKIIRPHGIRGEVKVEVWSDVPERFDPGSELLLELHGKSTGKSVGGPLRRLRIESVRFDRGIALVRFAGYSDRDRAEELRGGVLTVERERVPPPPDGLYYTWQLVGCECLDAELGLLGRVGDVLEDGGGHLLVVRREGKELLVPFVDAFLDEVDIDRGRIALRLPAGLIESCTSGS